MKEQNINSIVKIDTEQKDLKHLIVQYVGNKLQPDNEDVTINMIAEVMTKEFPEIVLAIAEENYLIGYKQGLEDQIALRNYKNLDKEDNK